MRVFVLLGAIALAIGCGGDDSVVESPSDASPDKGGGGSAGSSPDGSAPDRPTLEASPEASEATPDAETREADAVTGSEATEAGDGTKPDVSCVGGTVDCDGTCVDLASSPANCGRCGHGCLGGACLDSHCQLVPVATGLESPMGVVVVGTDIYATDFGGNPPSASNGALVRISPDGTQTTIVSGLGYPGALWYDQTTDSFLMPDYFGFAIVSHPLHADGGGADGGGVTTLVSNHLSFPLGLAANADSLFIVNVGDLEPEAIQQTIQRRPRSDLTQYTSFEEFPARPTHLDIDANYLYWPEMDAGRVVRRRLDAAPDAGSSATEVIASGQAQPSGIAVDGAIIYFSLYGSQLIDGGPVFGALMQVDNRPGSTPVRLATLPGNVEDVAVDSTAIYIAGRGSGTVWKLAK